MSSHEETEAQECQGERSECEGRTHALDISAEAVQPSFTFAQLHHCGRLLGNLPQPFML